MTVAKRERLDFLPLSPAEKRSMGKEGKKSKEKDREKISKKKAADAKAKLKKAEDDQDKEIARQIIKALRQAGLPDSQIKNNPAVKKSGLKVEEVK